MSRNNCAKILGSITVAACLLIPACGYTTKSALPDRLQTVYVDHFDNKINYAADATGGRNVYFPLLEVELRDAVIERFQFDGNLSVIDSPEDADLVLDGALVQYRRDALRFTDDNDAQEYRVQIVGKLELMDNAAGEPLWQYDRFIGEATYFVTGAQASSEESAVDEATTDLARRIVERTIENW
ncbi:MAG: LPS assembly lipoprotein LptE [Candidatus Omnitrophota bacterium]